MGRQEHSNYDAIREQPKDESFQYRDIRGEQDLKRQRRTGPASFTPYRVGAIVLTVFIAVIAYCIVSVCAWGISGVSAAVSGVAGQNQSAAGTTDAGNGGASGSAGSVGDSGGHGFSQDWEWVWSDELESFGYLWKSDGKVHREKPPGSSAGVGNNTPENVTGDSETADTNGNVGSADSGSTGSLSILGGFRPFGHAFIPNVWNVLLTLLIAGISFSIIYMKFKKLWEAQSAEQDVKNDHVEDVWLQTIEEMLEKYDYFPDKAGHMSVQPSSIIAHIGTTNKGIKTVRIAKRATEDILDENGNIDVYKGDFLRDGNDNIIFEEVPLFDEKFREELFDASGVPQDKNLRRSFDLTKIRYNPDGKDREKLGKYATVADLVNADCEIPYYEVGRPGGLYIVDTAPVNTMVWLALSA